MDSINEIVIDNYYSPPDINALQENTTHIRLYASDYVKPILNLPPSLKYFYRNHDNTGHCLRDLEN